MKKSCQGVVHAMLSKLTFEFALTAPHDTASEDDSSTDSGLLSLARAYDVLHSQEFAITLSPPFNSGFTIGSYSKRAKSCVQMLKSLRTACRKSAGQCALDIEQSLRFVPPPSIFTCGEADRSRDRLAKIHSLL